MVEQLDPPVVPTAADATTTPEGAPVGESWPASGPTGEARFRDWMAQLQTMIDGVATAAAPHVREIAAKAAELAAKAGDAAGPFAHRAAAATSDVGQKVAAKSRDFAADMRRVTEGEGASAGNGHEATAEAPADAAAESVTETPFTEPTTGA